jgi:hypothetical protein
MSSIILPASCYEEALPDLRAPYLPTQIRPLIINAPKNSQAPCRVALYTIGETLMDRFNLCCGSNWDKPLFTVKTHKERQRPGENGQTETVHYFKIECSLTVFGNEQSDSGEGESTSEALAEFNARAQAFKRAARWHGPGQCLYVFGGEELIMWRGPEAGKLHIPKSGTEPHRKPYFDNASRQAVRDEYAKWLHNEGESQFGVPLNHLQIAEAIRTRALHRPQIAVPDLSRALPDLSAATTAPAEDPEREPEQQLAPAPVQPAQIGPTAGSEQRAQPASAPRLAAPARRDVPRLPMPDAPASQEAVEIAQSAGFAGTVAHALSNLARTDGQEGRLSERQNKTVVNWLIVLSELHLTSDEIVEAVQFVAENGTGQERRQATFSRWLAGKASGQADKPAEQAPASTEVDPEVHDSEPAESTPAPLASDAADAAAIETARALSRIHKTMDEHGYPDRTVASLAKLSIGLPPKRTLEWAKVPASTMTILAELLESAAAIGWSADLLGKEVLAAHSRKGQATAAGRFSAFAGHLTELAEARRLSEAA